MRESTARGPSIDITEFERRLRGSGSNAAPKPGSGSSSAAGGQRAADPLTELARLLQGGDAEQAADPYRQVFAAERSQSAARARQEPPPQQQTAGRGSREEPFAADLRGSLQSERDDHDAYQSYEEYAQPAEADWSHYPEHQDYAESQDFLDYGLQGGEPDYGEAEPNGFFERVRSKLKPWHAAVGIAAIGAVSVGWGFAHRGGVVGPREIAVINAPQGPAKVQPPASVEKTGSPGGATVLDRTETASVNKVVSNEEQPIDPVVAPRVVTLGEGPVDAPHYPPPASATNVQSETLLPQPKRVKTVSVRPDGTIIDNDAVPPAVTRSAPPPQRAAALEDKGRGPVANDALSTLTPKSLPKPTATPSVSQPPRAKPAAVAAVGDPGAKDDAALPAATGGFAVQFSAAGSEDEARQLVRDVASKYSSHLDGRRVGYRRAKVGEKFVYRVRAAGFAKEAAVAVCEKVKSAGGNCFVASE